MKTMKNVLTAVLIAAFIMPVMQGCKKGEEDPGISFKSRNKRVTGTWTLKSYDISGTTNSTEKITNDVNDDDRDETIITTWSDTYNGSSLLNSNTYKEDYTQITMWHDALAIPPQWRDQEIVYAETTSSSSTEVYSFTIALYTDNTYEITETTGNASGTWEYDEDLDYDDGNDPAAAVEYSDKDDGDWATTGTSTSVTQGSWYWEDATKKGKLFINAGPIRGKVVRLSSKEMWVEIQYAELGGSGENTSSVGTDMDVMEDVPLQKQGSGDIPFIDMKNGDEETVTTWNNTTTEVMWVFEKTDKNSKRHKAE